MKIFSDDFRFEHQGERFLAKFQIPSKIWYSWYDTDLKLSNISLHVALNAFEIMISERYSPSIPWKVSL